MNGLTVIELRDKLNELIKEGHADKTVVVSFDSGCAGTDIRPDKEPIIYDTAIKFTGW